MSRGPGRPSKLTPALQDKICDKIAHGHTFERACTLCDIHVTTFCSWRAKGEKAKSGRYFEFLEATKIAGAEFIAIHLAHIETHALENWQASKFLLATADRDRYSDSREIRGTINMPDLVQAIRDIKNTDGTGAES